MHSLHVFNDDVAKLFRDLRSYAKPSLETWYGLMEQHAKPIHSLQTTCSCCFEQGSAQWHIDDIRHDSFTRQAIEIDGICLRSIHTQRGGVDEKFAVHQQIGKCVPGMGPCATTE